MGYINATSGVGVVWHFDSSTVASTGSFTVEAQSSSNILLLRNIYIPNSASTDVWIVHTTTAAQSSALFSGQVAPLNSFSFYLIGSSQLFRLRNNSNANIQWYGDGVVIRV